MVWPSAGVRASAMRNIIDGTQNFGWGMEARGKSGCGELTSGTRLNTFVKASGRVLYRPPSSSFQHRLSRIVSVT